MMRLFPLALLGLLVTTACTQMRLEGSIPLGGAGPPETQSAVALLPDDLKRLRAELVALGRSGTFFETVKTGEHTTWRGLDGSALVTQNGLVTATFGLGFDLISADVSDTWSRLRRTRPGEATRIHRYLDGENQVVTRAFRCEVSFSKQGSQTYLATEACRGSDVSFVNTYDILRDGAILTSLQWIGPELGFLRLGPLAQTRSINDGIIVIAN